MFTNFTKVCPDEDWQWFIIGLGDGLASSRRQAFTWTNDDPSHERIHASIGLNGSYQQFNLYIRAPICRRDLCITSRYYFILRTAGSNYKRPPEHWNNVNNCPFIWNNDDIYRHNKHSGGDTAATIPCYFTYFMSDALFVASPYVDSIQTIMNIESHSSL